MHLRMVYFAVWVRWFAFISAAGVQLVQANEIPLASQVYPKLFSTRESGAPRRFQYQWRLTARKDNKVQLNRRVVVERSGDKHAMLVMDERGFPLAHFVDNVAMCLSQAAEGEVTIYSGAGFRAHLGVTPNGKYGFATSAIIPAGMSESSCDVRRWLERLENGGKVRLDDPKQDCASINDAAGNQAIITFKPSDRQLCSISLRSKDVSMDLFGLVIDHEPVLSILEFSKTPKDFGELRGRTASISDGKLYPTDLVNLCQSISVQSDAMKVTSDNIHRRFKRNEVVLKAVSYRDRLSDLLREMEGLAEPKLRELNSVLDEMQFFDPRSSGSATRDPYVCAWQSEAVLGPINANKIRETLLFTCCSRKARSAERIAAFRTLCRLGWPPYYATAVHNSAKAIQKELGENVSADYGGVDWVVSLARDSAE